MTTLLRLVVADEDRGTRLDRYVARHAAAGSRAQVQRQIALGAIRVDGQPSKASVTLRPGQVIEVAPPPAATPLPLQPADIPLEVLFEDEHILVINKPAGLVVHPAPGHWEGTLVSALLHHWGMPPPGLDPLRPGIVHRLDKDTSGVLVVAKDPTTLAALAAQFHDRTVAKQYVAFVWGQVRKDQGVMADPIARDRVQRKRMAVRSGGRTAETRFEVVERFAEMTLVRLYPRTGRTHQLRVHLAAMGHPIVADTVYGRTRTERRVALPIRRQALHAERLLFRHPTSAAEMVFSAPWPADLNSLAKLCRQLVGRL